MQRFSIIILAAGQGVRMRSGLPKVLHQLAGKPMLAYVLAAAQALRPEKIVLVVSQEGNAVEQAFPGIPCVYQKEPLGTAHAVLQAEAFFAGYDGNLLILCGDTPMLKAQTLRRLLTRHPASGADLTLLFVKRSDPTGYGRLIFGPGGHLLRIMEEREATRQQKEISQVNAGVYLARARVLFSYLHKVKISPKKGEYYFTDLIEILAQEGRTVRAVEASDPEEFLGINSRQELAAAEKLLRHNKVKELMAAGVTFLDPDRAFVDADVKISRDTTIYPNTYILGKSVVGQQCLIEPNCLIVDSVIKQAATIGASSVIRGSVIGRGATIGPMAHLRPGSIIGARARIGNFVEVKKSRVGPGTKAGHLTYLGDSIIGADVNIGAGTITCNYDGRAKHQTIIADKVFVGSDTMFVAPVKIGKNAVTGAGSTITKDVPANALAVARARQVNIPGWRFRKK